MATLLTASGICQTALQCFTSGNEWTCDWAKYSYYHFQAHTHTKKRRNDWAGWLVVIQQSSETARSKPQLPLALAWGFKPWLGQLCLCTALPWCVGARSTVLGRLPSLPWSRFLDQRFIAMRGNGLLCLRHKAQLFHIPNCSFKYWLCMGGEGCEQKKRCAVHIKKKRNHFSEPSVLNVNVM